MLDIPSALRVQFDEQLEQLCVPKEMHWDYRKWLRYYLDFCHKYHFPITQKEILTKYISKLKEKKQTRSQQSQAFDAIKIFYKLHNTAVTTGAASQTNLDQKSPGGSKSFVSV